MMLCGYTLGFFYPKRAKDLQADQPQNTAAMASETKTDEDNDLPPAVSSERPEVPASLYFYRYF